jgi:FdhD protein
MRKSTRRVRVVEHTQDSQQAREDRVIGEEPLELRIGVLGGSSTRLWVTMRTPGDDFELAAGYVVAESYTLPANIARVAYCTEVKLAEAERDNVVTIWLRRAPLRGPQPPSDFGAGSACGVCGANSIQAVLDRQVRHLKNTEEISAQVVRQLPDQLAQHQRLFGQTGGVHAAGLFSLTGKALFVREDVGRHNAVDKVLGARVLATGDSAAGSNQPTILAVSGRAGYELVVKAITTDVWALVSVGAPTSLSVELAKEAGLQLFGFTNSGRTVRYA